MNLKQWRAQRAPTEHELPSGLEVRLQSVSLESVIASGQLPLSLLNELGNSKNGHIEIDLGSIMGNLSQYLPLLDAFAAAALAEVRISDTEWATPSAAELDPATLPFQDKSYIMKFATAGVAALRKFREGESSAA